MEIGVLLGLAHSLNSLCYVFACMMQTLPIPKKEWKSWAPTLLWDSCIGELAIGTVATVQLVVNAISNLLHTSLGGPLSSPATPLSTIISQLVAFDASVFSLIATLETTTQPIASILNQILWQCVTWSASAMISWSIIHVIISFIPTLWLTGYVIGICFFAIPFRIGRRLGSYLMSASIVLAIGLPLMPSIALWLQENIGYHLYLIQFEEIMSQVQGNPSVILELINIAHTTIGNLVATTIISLIVFPMVYIFMLLQLIRGLARLLGGTGMRTYLLRYLLMP